MQPTLPHIEDTTLPTDCCNLPDGWKVSHLGDFVTIKHGFAFSGHGFISEPECLPIVVTIGNYRYDGGFRFDTTSIKYYNQPYPKEYELTPGEILLAMTCQTMDGEILGLPAKIPNNSKIYLHNQRLGKVILTRPECVCTEFLYWIFLSSAFNKHLVETASGTKVRHTAPSRIEAYRLYLPPLQEQKQIAEILDAADATVRAIESLIEAKSRYKRALAEQLLTGKRRFPQFAGQAWREIKLGEVFREKSVRYSGDDPPIVLSCSKLYGILPQSERFSKQMASRDQRRYKYVEPGELVFDPMLLWDASISFSWLRGVVSPAYCTLRFISEEDDWRFFSYLLYTAGMRYTYKAISKGTNTRRKKVLASDFLKVKVHVPAPEEQRKITGVLDLLDEEIALLRRERDALKQQKQGLMQKLLTGQVRVKEFAS